MTVLVLQPWPLPLLPLINDNNDHNDNNNITREFLQFKLQCHLKLLVW